MMPDPFAPRPPLKNYIMLLSMQLRLTVTDCNGEAAELASPAFSHNNLPPATWLQWLDAEYARLRAKAEAHLTAMGERAADYERLGIKDNDYTALARSLGVLGTIPGPEASA